MHRPCNALTACALVTLASVISACGGGGGSDGDGRGGGSGGTLTVPTTTLTFIANGPSAPTPAPQTITGTVTGFPGGTLYLTIIGSGSAIHSISPVLLTSETSGQATVSVPPPSTLGMGTHTGTITVRACTSDPNCASGNLQGSPKTINVTYHVAALQSSVASFSYTLNNTPATGDATRQATITGIPAQNWSATTTADWLTVTENGGNGAALNATLAQSVVEGLTNGTYTTSIRVTPAAAGLPLVIPVSLTVARTQIDHVSPYVAYTGTSGDVIIRGEEFLQVTIQGVQFGDTPAQAYTVVGPTEIRATYPSSLPPGRHTVRLQTNFAGVRQFAELAVVDPPSFTAVALAYPSATDKAANALVYDAERAALGVSLWYHTGATAFVHFTSTNGAWRMPTEHLLTNNFGLALAADGAEWIAGADKTVVHFRASDLATLATVTTPLNGNGTQRVADLAVASDGTVAMFGDQHSTCGATLLLYDVRKQTFTTPSYSACRGNVGASGDGSRLLLTDQFNIGMDDVLSLDTRTGATAPSGIHLLTGAPPAIDRTGSRIVLGKTRVYDGSYAYLGDLPATTLAVVLSPDGTRAHAYDDSNELRSYDLSSPPVAGLFQQVGAGITLAGDPGRAAALYSDVELLMAITFDGSTVFIAGSDAVIVQPVP